MSFGGLAAVDFRRPGDAFLSCLSGSELLGFQVYALNGQRLSLFWQKYPLFLCVRVHSLNQ